MRSTISIVYAQYHLNCVVCNVSHFVCPLPPPQVIALLRKQERRAAIRKERASASGEGPGDGKPVKKTSIGGPLGQEERKKKIMSKWDQG